MVYLIIMTQMLAKEKKQVLVRLKPEVKKALRIVAAENDTSVSTIIEKLVEASLLLKDNS